MARINMNKWLPTQSAEASAPLRDRPITRSIEPAGSATFVPTTWLNLLTTALLYVIFALVVVPVGLVRRWTGKDSLHLRAFKKSNLSVWSVRNHTYRPEDLEKPF